MMYRLCGGSTITTVSVHSHSCCHCCDDLCTGRSYSCHLFLVLLQSVVVIVMSSFPCLTSESGGDSHVIFPVSDFREWW